MDERTAAGSHGRSMRGPHPHDANSASDDNISEAGDSFSDGYASPAPCFNRVGTGSDSASTVKASNAAAAAAAAGSPTTATPPRRGDRTYTDESATSSNGEVSKKTLVRIMREQVDLVRRLTNAQFSQRQELERVREEKRTLEERQRARDQQAAGSGIDGDGGGNASSRNLFKRFKGRQKNGHDDGGTTTAGGGDLAPGAIVDDDEEGPACTGPGACGYYSKDRIEITHIPDRDVVGGEGGRTCMSTTWWLFSRLCTLLVPDFCLFWVDRQMVASMAMSREAIEEATATRREAKQAWREKVAIFVIMLLFCAAFIGVSGVIPLFLCRETTAFTMDEIQAKERTEDWTVIFGTIYDVDDYASIHPGGPSAIREYVGEDASKLFSRRPPADLPLRCLDVEKDVNNGIFECKAFDEVDRPVNSQCHTNAVGFSGVNEYMGGHERGVLAHRLSNLKNDINTQWIMVYKRIYNVSIYIDSFKDNQTGVFDEGSEFAFLRNDLNRMILNSLGEDATGIYETLYNNEDDSVLSCLDDLFYVGVLDEKPNIYCQILSIVMYAIMIIIAGVLSIQCLCSLINLLRRKRTIKRDDTRSKMIVMVPCYNEGDRELRKTIDSVMDTSYPDDNKLLLVIADGNITGKGERCSTPETLAKILGYTMNPNDKVYSCASIGELTENRATLQYGIFKDAGKEMKYMVIVKCGLPSEEGSPRAGNRGKRDSQLIFSGLLNRFHHGRELNDLDNAIKNALDHLQLPLDEIRFLMAIDADTRIDRESLSHMTFSMNKNDRILALCGETKVENKTQSWVTMIQVFEYYTNHHMKKAFESTFGCVTCLPGCFTMYRLFSDDGRPLLSCDDVYQRYATNNVKTLHEKNLYHLGEDRMLTTLLLTYFPEMRLSFVPEACCYTIVPHTFSVLLSQRRRWINSTFHNMLELIRVNTMCGVCCISMKSIVILDMIATLILPASLIYVGYIICVTVWMGEPITLFIIVIWGIVIGVQVVVFLLRSRWDYFWWFLVFVLAGMPVFYFVLPLYSFWHMDDFSWGTTRQVSATATTAVKTPASSPEQSACLEQEKHAVKAKAARDEAKRLGQERVAVEAEVAREEAERLAQERLTTEAEAAREAAKSLAQERLAAELGLLTVNADLLEREILAAEAEAARKEAKRLMRKRIAAEAEAAKEEAERFEREKLFAKAEADREEAERLERERLAEEEAEHLVQEAEHLERERLDAEAESAREEAEHLEQAAEHESNASERASIPVDPPGYFGGGIYKLEDDDDDEGGADCQMSDLTSFDYFVGEDSVEFRRVAGSSMGGVPPQGNSTHGEEDNVKAESDDLVANIGDDVDTASDTSSVTNAESTWIRSDRVEVGLSGVDRLVIRRRDLNSHNC